MKEGEVRPDGVAREGAYRERDDRPKRERGAGDAEEQTQPGDGTRAGVTDRGAGQRWPTLPIVGAVDNGAAWVWFCAAIGFVSIPFLAGLTSSSRIFYIRDLSLYFWSRHLWLRRTLLSGEWPLWDPYIGGGQSAVADALHQMFLLPVLAIRLLGSEAWSFNLWIALPFPFAAVGTWLFFRRRFSAPASALGAIAFVLSGPVVSTGNFPNMSWSVASMPWVLLTADRLARTCRRRDAALLALAVAFQAFAGEPVTLSMTAALAMGICLLPQDTRRDDAASPPLRRLTWVAGGLVLGGMLAAMQLFPMIHAAGRSERATTILTGVWSMHPLGLLETVAPHLFGDYFTIPSLSAAPWMPLVNTGREPFFYSMYFGVPLFALALFGLVALGRNGWGVFWAAAGGASILLAFGVYTPVYPFLRDHLPILASFRFPAKYLVAFSMAVAAGAAAGWDHLRLGSEPNSSRARARVDAAVMAMLVAIVAGLVATAAIYFPAQTAERASALARAMDDLEPAAAGQFMVDALPHLGVSVVPVALAAAVLIFVAAGSGSVARVAGYGLYALIAGDLLVRSLGINPVIDVRYLAEPEWLSHTRANPDAKFYIGGKKDGTLDVWDPDASRGYLNAPGLSGSASRAALNGQSAFYPSGWRGREMLSTDLTLLWPKPFDVATKRFFESERTGRDLFLDRTGVRYRIMPERGAQGRTPLAKISYFLESSLYDWGPDVMPRAAVVPTARVVADPVEQIKALFMPGWDAREMVLVDRVTEAVGDVGRLSGHAPSSSAIEVDRSNYIRVRASAPAVGGYLLLLDSYDDDWRVTVDRHSGALLRANGLFRAVRLDPGSHVVELTYRPRAFLWGAAISGAAMLIAAAFVVRPQGVSQ